MRLFGLVDCNNFFVSCERVFNPKLIGKPVVVLSSNDGCIVARSGEVKALGVPMGAPYFKWKKMLERNGVAVFSSNFSLYGDMSHRVMKIIRDLAPEVEVYSVDEAFFMVENGTLAEATRFAKELRETILKWTGIPVSIGLASTKTLAKAANHVAKKSEEYGGVMNCEECQNHEEVLSKIEVGEIWGIGRQYSKMLHASNIKTALALASAPDEWVERSMSASGLATARELRGEPQYGMDEGPEHRKSVVSSRSFGRPVERLEDLREAISSYTAQAAETLREEGLVASRLTVYITTNRFNKETYYGNSYTADLPEPTSYTPELLHFAEYGLKQIFRPGNLYKKAGVVFTGISRIGERIPSLFESKEVRNKQERLMEAVDHTNCKWGRNTIQLAAEGISRPWRMRQDLKSKRFTTEWGELLTVSI